MTQPNAPNVATAGAVALDVEPDARGFYPKLRAQVLPQADALGREFGRQMSAPMVDHIARGMDDGVRRGGRPAAAAAGRVGRDAGAEMGRGLRQRVEAALRTLPDVEIDADSSAIERKVANVRRQLVELGGKTIDVDIDEEEALAKLQALRTQLAQLARDVEKVREAGGNIELDVDALAAGAQLTRLRNQILEARRAAERPIEVKAELSGRFEGELRRRMAAAQASLPDIRLDVDSSDTDRELFRLRSEIAALGDARIGVDLDAAAALAQIRRIQAELAALGNRSANVQVRADTAKATAELGAFSAFARAVESNDIDIDVDVDTGAATAQIAGLVAASAAGAGGMQILISVGALLAPIIVPAAAAAAAAVGAIGPAAIAGAAGIGVLLLGFSGVFGAISKINQQQQAAGRSASSLAGQQSRIAGAVASLQSAERSLANTRANARSAEVRSLGQIEAAERNLAAAQRAARIAQEGLTAARRDARRAMEDLESSVANGALAERDAILSVSEAREALDEVMTNPRTTQGERQRAQLAYDQAVQNLEDIRRRNQRLSEEQAESNRRGVEGSTQVQAARERIGDADERVAESQRALIDARRAADDQARQSAFQIAQAQSAVVNAQRSLAEAHRAAGAAATSAGAQQRDALAGLSAPAREFVRYIMSIKDEFGGLQDAAEAGLLPGVQAGIEALLPALPTVERLIFRLASAMGELFTRAGQALASPFWLDFLDTLGEFAGPAFDTFGDFLGGMARGFASLLTAFMPFSQSFGEGLADMADGFAEWAAGLSSSDGFASFIDYVRENGPVLLDFLGDLIGFVIDLGKLLAPLGALMLRGFAVLFDWLNGLDTGQLALLAGAIGAVVAVLVVAAGGPIAAVVIGLTLLVAAVVWAWQRFEVFRTVVTIVFDALRTVVVWFVTNIWIPYVQFIINWVRFAADAYLWLWRNVIAPAFAAIGAIISDWWNQVAYPIFRLISIVIRTIVVPIIMFLWRNVVQPAFAGIRLAISVAWAAIQVIFGLWQIALRLVGAAFVTFYRVFVKPYVDLIVNAITYAWTRWIRPALLALGTIIETQVAPAFRRGVLAIQKAWDTVANIVKTPVRIVVNTVLNDGLLAAYNKVAEIFNVNPKNVRIPLPKGFAGGGYVSGMGGPTSDSIMARLSNGEYVIPAHIVRAFGVQFFDWLIGKSPAGGKSTKPGDGSEGLAFAEGGFVGRIKGLWNGLKDPLGWIKGQVSGLVDRIPGAAAFVDVIKSMGRKLTAGVLDWLGDKITNRSGGGGKYLGPVSDDVRDIQQWIKAQAGKPYIWAGAGPAGYDCSGAVGSVYLMHHGRSPHSRIFNTESMGPYFPKAGHGVFTAGWAHPGQRGASPGVGHTAGNLAGLAFESRGGDGFVIGNRASSVDSFAHVGTYDTGGWLLPGLTVAYNGTGERERVLTGPQWDGVEKALAGRAGGGTSKSVTYLIQPRQAVLDEVGLRSITAEAELRERVGRQE
jgi:hypothetical protein